MTSTAISTSAPLTPDHAARLMRRVISSYPSANPMALKEYLSELASVLATYSEGVATAGIARAMGASPNFPPPVPLVKNHCDELIASTEAAHRYAREWEAQSQKQLLERAEQEANEEPLECRRAVAERILKEYHAQRTPETRPQRQTWRQFTAEELLAMYSTTA